MWRHHCLNNIYSIDSTNVFRTVLKHDMKYKYSSGVQEVIIEGDTSIVIQALKQRTARDVMYSNLIDDILAQASHPSFFDFCYVQRNCNKVADALVKKAKTGPELQVWIEELPDDIAPLALFDVG